MTGFVALLAGFFTWVSLATQNVTHYTAAAADPLTQGSLQESTTMLFAGDAMFDRTVRTKIDAKGGDYIFSCIDDTLQNADEVVINLEGPITANPSVSATSSPGDAFNYTFTFPPETASLLAKHHVTAVNLGNNHVLNFHTAGARSTVAYLDTAGVGYFGDPMLHKTLSLELHAIPLTLINYNEFGGKATTTLAQIHDAKKQGRIPIVYTHWGIEYATTSTSSQQKLAHAFVDAGAEIVIGSHPHVVQEHEVYAGKYIYYSLGNVIFDQYWNDDVRHGLLLAVEITKAGVQKVKEIPVVLQKDRRTCVENQ